jgi:survival-of-motor-neuron-related-splicing factor 30
MIQDSDLTVEELQQQINDYEEQLAVVDAALAQDPDQPEFLEVKTNLVDVLNVTKDLLRLKKETAPPIVYDNIQEIASRWGFFVGMKCEARWSEDNQW